MHQFRTDRPSFGILLSVEPQQHLLDAHFTTKFSFRGKFQFSSKFISLSIKLFHSLSQWALKFNQKVPQRQGIIFFCFLFLFQKPVNRCPVMNNLKRIRFHVLSPYFLVMEIHHKKLYFNLNLSFNVCPFFRNGAQFVPNI